MIHEFNHFLFTPLDKKPSLRSHVVHWLTLKLSSFMFLSV